MIKRDIIWLNQPAIFNVRAAAAKIAEEHDVPLDELLGKSQRRAVAYARWELFELLRRRRWSLSRIANIFGIHHTTVHHGLNRLEEKRAA